MYAALAALIVSAGPHAAGAGDAVWPLVPRPEVVRGFDLPASPWGAGHRGVDLLGHVGESVHAAAAGRVTFVGRLAGRGVVVVDHGAVRTTYEPVTASVLVTEMVGEGQEIGRLERGMSHCFPRACLHWGLLRGDTYLDPLTLVGAGPVRLLPLQGIQASRVVSSSVWSWWRVWPVRPADVPAGKPVAVARW
ncbi:MAG: M23 family metallopeptidase [Actinomycetota bacterium]|nr:M23 family metallopeptidase [Actinomycetota bacterium]